jgi:hypothetical protein
MKTKHIYFTDLHFEHTLWRNELSFFKDEIEIYERRLTEVANQNTQVTILAQLEQLQNRFTLEKKALSDLKHAIKNKAAALTAVIESNPTAIEHVHFEDQTELRGKMERFRQLYSELKKDCNIFVAKHL